MNRAAPPMIYVADDDAAVRDSLRALLEAAGYGVRAFSSGDALLDAYQAGCASCLVVDVDMPGASGIEVQRELAERGAGVPVIVISGCGSAEQAARALAAGAADYLDKPIARKALLASIGRALKDRPDDRAPGAMKFRDPA